MERSKRYEKKFNPRKMNKDEDIETVNEQKYKSKDTRHKSSSNQNKNQDTWNN